MSGKRKETLSITMSFRVSKTDAERIEREAAKAKNRNVFIREAVLAALPGK